MVSAQDLRGKVWILNVWASWCVACRIEHPVLVEFSKTSPVPMYGLNYKDKRDDADALAGQFWQPVPRRCPTPTAWWASTLVSMACPRPL
jgi:cytochrome c biogenesis protein CcmG/thiol:disulfide interchange protein DsbE